MTTEEIVKQIKKLTAQVRKEGREGDKTDGKIFLEINQEQIDALGRARMILSELCKERESEYPENLLTEIGAETVPPLTPGQYMGLQYVLEHGLSNREAQVIDLRYKRGMTLEGTAKVFDVTRERIRQVEAKAIRKMRHPTRLRYIQAGLDKMEAYQDARRQLEDATAELMAEKIRIELKRKELAEGKEQEARESDPDNWLHRDILDLELSIRSYHCLKRRGCDTVEDVLRLGDAELLKVRNLGRKSIAEIDARLREHGLTRIKEESDD